MAFTVTDAPEQQRLDAAKVARKWKSEIDLAGKREKDWRDEAEKILKIYRGDNRRANSFNILWSNTEILRPAIYNSLPKPDVRRRFRDSDPLGKAVAEIMERSLYVITDHYDTDCAFKNDALDSCLVGRGISRVRYLPSIKQTPLPDSSEEDDELPQVDEEVEYETVIPEHVNWKDFRHGWGRIWAEVPWVGFRHQLTEGEAEKKFGEDTLEEVKFAPQTIESEKKQEVATETEKVAEFWEIWDKESQKVFFVQDKVTKLLFPLESPKGEPPLKLNGFFPCPEPMRIVENTDSLVPIPVFRLYEQQAKELDRISTRINKIVEALRLRGAYDSSLSEMPDIMSAHDNDLVPLSKAAAWRDNGGLDKAITWLPIGPASQVLEQLNMARDRAKQIIYEITGISDIVRGASVASETATAQQIKAQYASVRLKKMQQEMQRYTRDVLRLCSEVIAEKFGQDTLSKMTGLQFPTQMQQQQAQAHWQQQAMMQPQQPGQPPPEPPPQLQAMMGMPNWEAITQLLHNDGLRDFKIDVETDSTVAASIESDMQSLSQVITALGQTMSVFGPLVQDQVMPLDSAKQILLSVCRRAKLGLAVEDSIEAMQQPPPKQPDPPPPDSSPQVAQIKAQSDQQLAQLKAQSDAQAGQMKMQQEVQIEQITKQHEMQLEQARIDGENLRTATQLETQRQIADANNATQLRIAQMAQDHASQLQSEKLAHEGQVAQLNADIKTSPDNNASKERMQQTQLAHDKEMEQMKLLAAPAAADYKQIEADSPMVKSMQQLIPLMTQVAMHIAKPKRVVRDAAGKIAGVE